MMRAYTGVVVYCCSGVVIAAVQVMVQALLGGVVGTIWV